MSRLVLALITLIVVGFFVCANIVVRAAQYSGERRLPACSRRQPADDHRTQKLFGRLPKRAGKLPALPGGESELRGIFQQLDHAFEQTPRAAAIQAAMIEAQGDLGFGHGNEF